MLPSCFTLRQNFDGKHIFLAFVIDIFQDKRIKEDMINLEF